MLNLTGTAKGWVVQSYLLGNWGLKLPWNSPKILYMFHCILRCAMSDTLKWTWRAMIWLLSLSTLLQLSFHKFLQIFVNIEIKRQRRPFSFILTKIFETSFEGGPLWLVWLFGRSDQNVPFNLTKLLSWVLLFCILLTRTITKCPVAWVGSV